MLNKCCLVLQDTIQTFYDITRREVETLELKTSAKDREMELMEDNHRYLRLSSTVPSGVVIHIKSTLAESSDVYPYLVQGTKWSSQLKHCSLGCRVDYIRSCAPCSLPMFRRIYRARTELSLWLKDSSPRGTLVQVSQPVCSCVQPTTIKAVL